MQVLHHLKLIMTIWGEKQKQFEKICIILSDNQLDADK